MNLFKLALFHTLGNVGLVVALLLLERGEWWAALACLLYAGGMVALGWIGHGLDRIRVKHQGQLSAMEAAATHSNIHQSDEGRGQRL